MISGLNCLISENSIIAADVVIGNNVIIGDNVIIGSGSKICDGVIIGKNSVLGENAYLDYGVLLREEVKIGKNAFIGARCIIGEYLVDFIENRDCQKHTTFIGDNAVIRSETIIYGDNEIGDNFISGHRVTIREKSSIGRNVRIGTLSDIQGDCVIGNYVSMHSNVHIGQKSVIKDYAWIYPYVILTNDPNPPSEQMMGVTVEEFAVVATGTVVLPGKTIGKDALVGAGATVTKDVAEGKVVVGNPIKEIADVTSIINRTTGMPSYPWRYYFDRGMPWNGQDYDEWEANHGEYTK